MVNLLVAAAIAAASPSIATPAAAQPAMFRIQDADTTIYLFGTFHALDGDPSWFDSAVRAAFDRSDELVLETLLPEGGAPIVRPGTAVGSPAVAPSPSFLAGTTMVLNAGRSKGMEVGNGADMVLRHVAEADGKPVVGLETLELQLRMFDKLRAAAPVQPASAPKAVSPNAARPTADVSRAMGTMEQAWKHGDQAMFARVIDQLRTGAPDLYRMMFADRNTRWADWVAARMRLPGVVFVAVGAGHLAGRDSLLVRLAERGVESQRVN